MADEYKFTWSTKSFYSRDNYDDRTIKKLKTSPKPKKFAQEVIANAPNWVKKFSMPSKERVRW